MGRRILFLRHGDTGYSGHFQGAGDVPLSAEGEAQIVQLVQGFVGQCFSTIYCSPMLRCRRTLELLAPGREALFHDALREMDFGRWEGARFDEVAARDPHAVERWQQEGEAFTFPDGESLTGFRQRLRPFCTELEAGQGDTFIVAHGGVIRHLLCLLLRLPLENWLLFELHPGHFCEVRLHSEGGVLTGFNQRELTSWQK